MGFWDIAISCFNGYSTQMRETRDHELQLMIHLKELNILTTMNQAAVIARESDDDLLRSLFQYSSAQSEETFKLRDRYNKLVENVNAYNDAVNNLVATVNRIMNQQRTARPAPTFNFNFVRPQPITCTGNTLAFSNSTAYFNNLDTVTNATTTIHCQ
jgi:hypothetical protein